MKPWDAWDEILSQEPMENTGAQKRPADAAVSFDHVTFTYPGADRPALSDVSFAVRPGQVTALVGPLRGRQDDSSQPYPPLLGCRQRRRLPSGASMSKKWIRKT